MALKENITIDQGTTFSHSFLSKNSNGEIFDTTGYTANGQIRKHYSTTNSTAVFTTTVNSTAVAVSLAANATSNVAFGRYVYDVTVTSPANVIIRIIEGVATITPRVTR